MLLNYREVRIEKILVEFFFLQVYEPRSINLQKKKETNISQNGPKKLVQ